MFTAIKKFQLGTNPRLVVTYKDPETGDLVDPLSVVITVRKPDKATITETYGVGPNLVRDGIGEFSYRVRLDSAGTWRWKFAATTVTENSVVVGELQCIDEF